MEQHPEVISYFIEQGINPIFCVGAFPGCLGKLLEIKGVPNPDAFIRGLNDYLLERTKKSE
ncbi:hypothetical protein Tph_c21640 [Thermacetogenium phaeum DSM 12270]|uniref:Uncharacterized protein n=2 Tax=Thermacetogenium phaeum TaxID=85874 RepID=K4LJY6_THEPS|nr:hypothetical protein Tph_c21640 [Thermacetogenium phaeum DSM 12270]